MYCKQATAATNWWIEQMKRRCKRIYPKKIVENDSILIIVDNELAEDFSRFQKILLDEIQEHIEKQHYINLNCYHYPNYDLSKIAKKAHISNTYFPLYAEMQIWGKSIEVATGNSDLRNLPIPEL